MAYRTFRQGAADASMPEDSTGYEDYMATPEGRAKANALALLMGGAGSLAYKGASMLPSVGSGSLRQWLATTGARSAAPEAVLMEPAAGVAARNAITQGSVMSPSTAGATLMAAAPIVMAKPNMPTNAPVYDYDEHSIPQDFDTWGRKIAGPSAATNSMDAPANAVSTAKRVLPPLPVARPGAPGQNLTSDAKPIPEQGFFARNFGQDPYAGKSASQLMAAANQDPDNAAAFFRADKALQKERPEMFQSAPAEKRGGAIKGDAAPGKDAALHKALEIIHHLLTRGH